VVTTENSDWATNCPEYKVTAVQVMVTTEAARAASLESVEASVRGKRGERVPDDVMATATEAMARRR
jgi:predicted molibdopterin-dependent oxidoreductase YjgC